jgi:transcriptional regulator GlxA family with amidase domain
VVRRAVVDRHWTPYDYIKTWRLEEARRLIEGETHAIGDVAMLVGYETTAFTKNFGTPPSAFRRAGRRKRS